MSYTLYYLVDLGFRIYTFILLARILISWVPGLDWHNPVVQFLYRATEPVLRPFRQVIPPIGGFDLSPILAFFVLRLVRQFILRLVLRIF